MSQSFLSTQNLPFCKGCGHHIVAQNTEKALQQIKDLTPMDVVLVTDIGCIGIIDKQYYTHTVHGLHGRSIALATGIALGLANPAKKVLVLLGDGGATIGLQHLMEAAQRNINMTVIVHNNMLYGMTGGQPSGLTPCGFKTPIMPQGKPNPGYDLCQVVHSVGAPYSRRLIALGDLSNELLEAFNTRGFSFIEAMELCPSYGMKFNPNRKLDDIAKEAGLEIKLYTNPEKEHYQPQLREKLPSLFEAEKPVAVKYKSELKKRYALFLSGSAGEGVQSAAEFLAQAAISCGLNVTKKGSYPVTVGVGFSTSEIIISPEAIKYTGIEHPDAVIANSTDGLGKVRPVIEKMETGKLFLDSSLEAPQTKAKTVKLDYRTPAGARNSSLLAVMHFVKSEGIIPMEALLEVIKASKVGKKLDLEAMQKAI
jgi:pyruvate/2-oxoacid:ferredoxin oxidoreductase beta subunit